MSRWKERLLRAPVIRGWFPAEPDEIVDLVTLALMAASVALLGSLVV